MPKALTNWKTTAAAVFLAAGSLLTAIAAQLDANPSTVPDWDVTIGLIGADDQVDGRDTCTWYVDGVAVKSLSVSTTGFPDGEELTPVLSAKISSDNALNVDMDWIAFAQEAV